MCCCRCRSLSWCWWCCWIGWFWTCTCQEGQRKNYLEYMKCITLYTRSLSCTSKILIGQVFMSRTELAHCHRDAISLCFSVCLRHRETHSSVGCGDFCMKDLLLKLGCNDTILFLMIFFLFFSLLFWVLGASLLCASQMGAIPATAPAALLP